MSELNRRALIHLGTEYIRRILDLPEGYTVLHVATEFDPASIVVVVHSDDLQPVAEGCRMPEVHGSLAREDALVDGRIFSRWTWTPRDPE